MGFSTVGLLAHLLLLQKLRPFFPPLAPLQSLNLRAALYRGLTDLKKNGILGKEATLRKTMLDECKGDKFEEVIRVFAMTVLRKEARQRLRGAPPIPTGYAETLTGPEYLTAEQHEILIPLVLAHTKILQRQLSERRRINGKLGDEKRRLDNAHARLAEKRKAILAREGQFPGMKPEELEAMSDQVRAAWTGNEQWAETLICGGPGDLDQFVTEKSLPSGTQQISSTTEHEFPISHTSSLLVDLDERIGKQQSRLRKWTEFRASLERSQKGKIENVQTVSRKKKPLLDFNAHQGLQIVKLKEPTASAETVRQARSYHSEVIEAMRTELAKLRGSPTLRRLPLSRIDVLANEPNDVPQKHESASTTDNTGDHPPQANMSDSETSREESPTGHLSTVLGEGRSRDLKHVPDSSSLIRLDGVEGISPTQDSDLAPKCSPLGRPSINNDGIRSSTRPAVEALDAHCQESSTSQTLPTSHSKDDDEISSPNPNKSRLTSSPSTHGLLPNEVHNQQPTQPAPPESTPDIHSPPNLPSSPPKPLMSTLLERTRQSMALLPSSSFDSHQTRPKPHTTNKTPHRQKPRPSSHISFPQNQFSTPHQIPPQIPNHSLADPKLFSPPPPASALRSGSGLGSASASSRPEDDIFSEQADYASVFKSRPRVAVSPPPIDTPVVVVGPERSSGRGIGGFGVGFLGGDGDGDEDESDVGFNGGADGFSSSPA